MRQNDTLMKILPYSVLLVILLTGLFGSSPTAFGLPITSSKGKTVDFAGVKSASPAGLEVQVKSGGPTLTLPWSRLDLKKLETENPKIHEARKQALDGKKVALNLGSFTPKKPMATKPSGRTGRLAADGIYESTLKGKSSDNFATFKMALKVPGGKANGILIRVDGSASKSDDANGTLVMIESTTTEAISGAWRSYALQHGLAVAGIVVDNGAGAKQGNAAHHDVSKGTGDGLLRAIDMLADISKRPELKTVPLILYGEGAGGAAFVYNFAQWKPERVAAVVAQKGAFYDAIPTEISAKVPLMFIQGEYDDEWELYGGKNLADEVFEKYAGLKPNWTFALEFQGTSGGSLLTYTMSREFFDRVVPMRIGDEGLKEIDRSISWIGDMASKKVNKAGSGTDWAAGKTWLPDARFAKTWSDFVTGELEASPPE